MKMMRTIDGIHSPPKTVDETFSASRSFSKETRVVSPESDKSFVCMSKPWFTPEEWMETRVRPQETNRNRTKQTWTCSTNWARRNWLPICNVDNMRWDVHESKQSTNVTSRDTDGSRVKSFHNKWHPASYNWEERSRPLDKPTMKWSVRLGLARWQTKGS